MKAIVVLLGIVGAVSFADDKDTIPLRNRTAAVPEGAVLPMGKPIAPNGTETLPVVQSKSANVATPAKPIASPPKNNSQIKPYVASIEVFGSSRINEILLKDMLGTELNDWITKGLNGDPKSVEMEVQLAERVRTKFGFAFAEWSVVQYFQPEDLAIHITLDVIEPQEFEKRTPFIPNPNGEYKDPDFLVKHWIEYENTALDLIEVGELEPESSTCPAFHCPFGHKHAKLKKYEKIFVDGVKKHAKELLEIQTNDKRPDFRAASTYLLAYQKDGKKVVQQMVERIKDSDAIVRNNALRVLGDIAEFHPELLIPVRPVLEAFHFPRVSDRSKAVYLAYLLALSSAQAREEILKTSVPSLFQIMGSKQPDHRDMAHSILRKISGKEYSSSDLQAWNNWFSKLPKDREISKK